MWSQNQNQQQGLPLSSLMSGNKSPLSICVWTIFAILTFGEMDLSARPEVSSIARTWAGAEAGLILFVLTFSPFREHKGKNGEI